jgi:hypothetical protein
MLILAAVCGQEKGSKRSGGHTFDVPPINDILVGGQHQLRVPHEGNEVLVTEIMRIIIQR